MVLDGTVDEGCQVVGGGIDIVLGRGDGQLGHQVI